MSVDDLVKVKAKGEGAVAFCAGQKYALILAAGETADKWKDGSPITRAEFDALLAREGLFEIAPDGAQG